MATLERFKRHVEDLLKITDWNPTPIQLDEIVRRFGAMVPPKNVSDAIAIVQAICPPKLFFLVEGVDNSDLRALLALAIAAARS